MDADKQLGRSPQKEANKNFMMANKVWLGCLGFALSFATVFTLLGWGSQYVTSSLPQMQSYLNTVVAQLAFAPQAASEPKNIANPMIVPAPYLAMQKLTAPPDEALPSAPGLSSYERLKNMDPHHALSDPMSRISKDFHVPAGLEKRVKFWFDIYTRHDGNTHVIHHVRYPWITYKVVDTNAMIENGNGPLWLRRQRALNFVQAERIRVQRTLKRLAQRKSYVKLTTEEKEIFDLLKDLKGPRQKVFRVAQTEVRAQLGQKDFFVSALRNSSRYLPYMEEEFTELGVPVELTRIPFVESSFNEKAVSKVGASGIWQIMPKTGKAYMLVDDHVDERNSPLKSTYVAAKLLRQYNRSLKSWPLAVTSYNHGIGNIQKAIRAAGSRDLPTIIDRYHRGDFKFASSNFYSCVLAALHAEKYHDVLFPYISRERLFEREVIKLNSSMRMNSLAKRLNLKSEDLIAYNQDLRGSAKKNPLLRKGYKLHLPPGMNEPLLLKIGTRDQTLGRQALQERGSKKPI